MASGYKNMYNPLLKKGFQKIIPKEYHKFDCTVGIDGDYPTIYEALEDGRRRLKLISDVTETTTWSDYIHLGEEILIQSDAKYKIYLSEENTYTGNTYSDIYFVNIELILTNDKDIFGHYNNFYFDDSIITGNDTSLAILVSDLSYIEGNKLTINAKRGIKIRFIRNISSLILNGDGYASDIQTYTGVIQYLQVNGSFGTDYNTTYFIVLNYSSILLVDNRTGTDYPTLWLYNNSSLYKTTKINRINIIVFTNNCSVEKSYINVIRIRYSTIQNIIVKDNNIISFTANTLIGQFDEFSNNIIENDIIVNTDNITLFSNTINNGTITILSTADKVVCIANRTLTDIVDNNPTSTQKIANNTL